MTTLAAVPPVDAIFRNDYPWLLGRLRYKLGCAFTAEDIASETFVQLIAQAGTSSVREPRALLTTIAHRLVYDFWRRRDLERAYLAVLAARPESVAPSEEERALVVETLHAIDRMLAGLSAKARNAFIYSQFHGLTHAEIADRLGVSKRTVRDYLAQALRACYLASLQ
ncbi:MULTISPECIES: sigma-70 family RNA polymerase sigma factor [Burkholderia]|uniref:Sigma-70 family RNA polymerase sigma factor n=1 Tax=Burkholderia anthinoferrum TaxID=3090833 RepID=A0ABU5WVX2_9BURK|nr:MULTISPECIES: sigma-70 family RNA polymerase sigma factor [Burkholderia]MEB2504101.1 sigma-70 family RNA polymerase sigma factor [Burkholderia anthinoferrum]MEB2535504.1 sigma-70 family RNA polymerase sigma factor [Burkholderia anthinoferrum]MEB2563880.1 sigma-70 family RNA polymerase sigma factor [Burkholderia anthinoferrum]MEB2582829.1 sigma-70 family RNA polymerase sigma factor [Burkholderia anthinoferrum]KVH03942.1 RNA polymerase subunit sigma [Burkholderia anthina]